MKITINDRPQDGNRKRRWQGTLAGLLSVALISCESGPPLGTIGNVSGFAGAAIADEPQAALAARDVLAAGGSAADAAVALYFALAVTMPSTASLGGGGICVVHDAESKTDEVLDFLPRAAAGGRVAIPSGVRGMAALQARYGRLQWSQLVGAAEQLARFGTPVSQALSAEIATAADALKRDPELAKILFRPDGTPLQQGDPLRQELLAGALAQIRIRGAGEFHQGPLGRQISDAAQAIGAPLTIDDLRNVRPEYRPALVIEVGDHQLATAAPPEGGAIVAQTVAMLDAIGFGDSEPDEHPHMIAEATKRSSIAAAGYGQPDGTIAGDPATLVLPERIDAAMASYDAGRATPVGTLGAVSRQLQNPWATGFVVADGDGNAVACNLTMNNIFGAFATAPGTGIILAPAPSAEGAGFRALGPAILSNRFSGQLLFAGAASGGETGPTALAQVFARVAMVGQNLGDAMRSGRFHHNGDPDLVFVEPLASSADLAGLTQRGHATETLDIIGRVNAIWCPEGLENAPRLCEADADPRAFGMAVVQDE